MHPDRQAAATAALDALVDEDRDQVVALLCRDRPEAVLGAVETLKRHQAVVAGLRSTTAPQQRSWRP